MSSKSFDIELIYDDELVLAGEQLWTDHHVHLQAISDDGVHIIKVADGTDYETEIRYPFTKKQKATCECITFRKDAICKHIIAALFALRKQLKKSELQKKANSISVKPASLNINQIIQDIRPEDLKSFIKTYAKDDKRFATHLKVTFAHKIDLADNIEKYRAILNSIVRPVTTLSHKIAASELKYLMRVLKDFEDQINDNIALSHYRAALDIFIASFSKLEYVRSKYHMQDEALTSLSQRYHAIIGYFVQSRLPAELKQELHRELTDFIQRSYYRFTDFKYNILYFLLPNLNTAERNRIKEILLKLLASNPASESAVILAYYMLLCKKYDKEAASFFKDNPLNFTEVVQLFTLNGHNQLALEMLEKAYKIRPDDKDIINRLLNLYILTDNKARIITLGQHAYINTGDTKYLELLRKELPEEKYSMVTFEIETGFYNQEKPASGPALNFFRYEENWAGMLIYLEKNLSISDLQKYDTYLYRFEPDTLSELYCLCLDEILKNQLGDTSQLLLEQLKLHWLHNDMHTTIQVVKRFLEEHYGHRPGLIEVFR